MTAVTCHKCGRTAYASDIFGSPPTGVLLLVWGNPPTCAECDKALLATPVESFVIRHELSETEYLIKAAGAAAAIQKHLEDVQVHAGKVLDVGPLRAYLNCLTIRGYNDAFGSGKPAIDVLLQRVIKEYSGRG